MNATPTKQSIWQLYRDVLEDQEIKVVHCSGGPGVGKTFGAYNYGVNGVDDYYALTVTEETSAAELRGFYQMKGNQTEWVDGPVVRAMREGKRVVVNELSHGNGDVQDLMMPVTESEITARMTLPNGETVIAAPGFRVVVTDNEPVEKLPEALRDRMEVQLHVDEPHPDALALLDDDLRRVAEQGAQIDDERRISARGWLTVQKLRGRYGLKTACLLAFGAGRGAMVFDAIKMAQAEMKRPSKRSKRSKQS